MTYVKIGDRQIAAEINGVLVDRSWGARDSKTIHCAMTYAEAMELFHDDLEWGIVYIPESYMGEDGVMVELEPEFYDNSDYCIAGPITDNRDGTVAVKMGKPTADELLAVLTGEV